VGARGCDSPGLPGEARFEPRSYGFGPGRGCHDAISAVFNTCKGPRAKRVWALDADLAAALGASSHCSFADCPALEQAALGGGQLDTQAFSASGAGEDGAELAALDTLQHGLAGDAQGAGGVLHGDPAFGCVIDEHGAQFVGEADPPGRAGGELLAGDEAVVEPAQQGGGGDPELVGGGGHGEQLSVLRLIAGLVAGDLPVMPKRLHPTGGERQSPGGGPALSVEDPGDLGVGVVHGESPDELDGVLVGADRRWFAPDRGGAISELPPPPGSRWIQRWLKAGEVCVRRVRFPSDVLGQ
jgi:hypothetical protein